MRYQKQLKHSPSQLRSLLGRLLHLLLVHLLVARLWYRSGVELLQLRLVVLSCSAVQSRICLLRRSFFLLLLLLLLNSLV
jgi:hypothetical protein